MTAYLDHAAGTPVRPEVVEVLTLALGTYGNPTSLHGRGRLARRTVEEGREQIAADLGARPSEVVLTGGGTESDNLALKGALWAARAADPGRDRLIISAVEHHAVGDAADWLAAAQGARVTVVPVDAAGRVDPDALRAALLADGGPGTAALVSVMWASNELGTVQPVRALAEVAHAHGVPLHTDAVQAVGALPVDFAASGADALTVAAHKHGGPPGAGVLLARRSLGLTALLHGGGQERDLRSGTVDAASVAGMARGTALAVADQPAAAVRLERLRERLVSAVSQIVPDVEVGGDHDPRGRLPGIASLRFPGCEGDALLLLLDAQGVEVSTGSACSAGVARPSPVLMATGLSAHEARSALRISLGWTSGEADVDAFATSIGPAVERARAASRPQLVGR